jgi:hypothetical protein
MRRRMSPMRSRARATVAAEGEEEAEAKAAALEEVAEELLLRGGEERTG